MCLPSTTIKLSDDKWIECFKGETIKTIVEGLERLGYQWAYRTINSLSFVPQSRRRVFVVASLNHDPKDVLLSTDCKKVLGEINQEVFTEYKASICRMKY